MEILKKKKIFFFFLRLGIFFFKLGKKSPKSHWERARISAPEDTKKSLGVVRGLIVNSYNYRMFYFPGEKLPHFTDPI